jgi:hypothetical protein
MQRMRRLSGIHDRPRRLSFATVCRYGLPQSARVGFAAAGRCDFINRLRAPVPQPPHPSRAGTREPPNTRSGCLKKKCASEIFQHRRHRPADYAIMGADDVVLLRGGAARSSLIFGAAFSARSGAPSLPGARRRRCSRADSPMLLLAARSTLLEMLSPCLSKFRRGEVSQTRLRPRSSRSLGSDAALGLPEVMIQIGMA